MARKAREKSGTGIYAVSLKGQTDVFKTASMRETFSEGCQKYLGEGLMAIRFHKDKAEMLIKESEKGISMDMKPLITSFARAFNRENGDCGKVFADRFKSVPVEDDMVKEECITYLNGEKSSAAVFMPKRSGGSKAPVKKPVQSAPKPKQDPKPKPVQETTEEPKPKPKQRNLPTWLL